MYKIYEGLPGGSCKQHNVRKKSISLHDTYNLTFIYHGKLTTLGKTISVFLSFNVTPDWLISKVSNIKCLVGIMWLF